MVFGQHIQGLASAPRAVGNSRSRALGSQWDCCALQGRESIEEMKRFVFAVLSEGNECLEKV